MSTRRSFLKRLSLAIPMAALATELSFSSLLETEENLNDLSLVRNSYKVMSDEDNKKMHDFMMKLERKIWYGKI